MDSEDCEKSNKGKIIITSFNNALEMDLSDIQLKLQIVRSINKGLIRGFIQVSQLAPSDVLFNKTMYSWKKLKFTKEEQIFMNNGKTQTWFDLYERDFKIETNSAKFQRMYNRLKERLNQGDNAILICYCDNYNYCHRKIVGEMLIRDGFEVEFI